MSLADAIATGAVAQLLALVREVGGGAAVAVLDPAGDVVAGDPPAGSRSRWRSHPVAVDGRVVGMIVADAGAAPALVALLARSLELAAGSAAEAVARGRLTEELEIGRRIQRSLIPRRFPDVPGWSFGAAYEAATQVGGDLYDAFTLRGRSGQLGLLVADVTGKGIPAALLMADARALLHAATDNADGPADALGRVNRILARERANELFVTAVLLVADAATGRMRYASAGHEPPLVARGRDGRVEVLDAEGPLLGAFEDAAFDEHEASLEPGDTLVLYTDGITETRAPDRAFFGDERLTAAVEGALREGAAAVVDAIMGAVRAFRRDAEAFDDLALLVARRDRA